MTDHCSERSYAALTGEHLVRLATLAAADDRYFGQHHPGWATELLASCLVQGAARHYLRGDRGIKDFDIYLFYGLPAGRNPAHFPWNRGATTRNRDFGLSEFGRQLYTAADRSDPYLAAKIPHWERFLGRRVDIMSRSVAPHVDGAKAAIMQWLERGRRRRHSTTSTDWNLSRAPVICLHPCVGDVWWAGPAVDEAGIEKGANGAAINVLPSVDYRT